MRDGTMTDSPGCSMPQQDLVLHLYGELAPERRAAVEDHMRGCAACRSDLSSLRETMAAIEKIRPARLDEIGSDVDWDREWERLEGRLRSIGRGSARGAAWLTPPMLLKAAAVLLVAGASFAIGHQWDALRSLGGFGSARATSPPAGSLPDGTIPRDTEARMRFFSLQTHGYLNRSRLVLLEISNGRETTDGSGLRDASLNLLRETKTARRVAQEMADPHLEELTEQLDGILKEISGLSGSDDAAAIDKIRSEVNQSGLLTQLELLCLAPTQIAQERS